MLVKFPQKVVINGTELKDIEIKLEDLRGLDLLNAEREAKALDNQLILANISTPYYICVAAKALNIPPDELISLPAQAFNTLVQKVQNFFVSGG